MSHGAVGEVQVRTDGLPGWRGKICYHTLPEYWCVAVPGNRLDTVSDGALVNRSIG